jgi:hypothetical protein
MHKYQQEANKPGWQTLVKQVIFKQFDMPLYGSVLNALS